MAKYDYLIVGAGMFGSVFAREMTDAGKKCLVIDKRKHIAVTAIQKKFLVSMFHNMVATYFTQTTNVFGSMLIGLLSLNSITISSA